MQCDVLSHLCACNDHYSPTNLTLQSMNTPRIINQPISTPLCLHCDCACNGIWNFIALWYIFQAAKDILYWKGNTCSSPTPVWWRDSTDFVPSSKFNRMPCWRLWPRFILLHWCPLPSLLVCYQWRAVLCLIENIVVPSALMFFEVCRSQSDRFSHLHNLSNLFV